MKVNLCRCNNCNNIFIDQNPQVDAKIYDIIENQYPSLNWTGGLIEYKDEEARWICPICGTDDFLNDDV